LNYQKKETLNPIKLKRAVFLIMFIHRRLEIICIYIVLKVRKNHIVVGNPPILHRIGSQTSS
jgi:hypothetical protein